MAESESHDQDRERNEEPGDRPCQPHIEPGTVTVRIPPDGIPEPGPKLAGFAL